jgi:hypothetical protein
MRTAERARLKAERSGRHWAGAAVPVRGGVGLMEAPVGSASTKYGTEARGAGLAVGGTGTSARHPLTVPVPVTANP